MAEDVTKLLIQMVTGGASQADALAVNSSVLGSTADLVSSVANYAQIIGTAEQPLALAASVITTEGAVVEATSLTTLATTGVGAFVVILASILFALANSTSESDQSFQALVDAVPADESGGYWLNKLTGSLSTLWSPVGADLDDLAAEGTGGPNVQSGVSHYHEDALIFIRHLVEDIGFEQYWQVQPNPVEDVPQSSSPPTTNIVGINTDFWQYLSWYGKFPTRLSVKDSPSGGMCLILGP
jgi:hypothetical protein